MKEHWTEPNYSELDPGIRDLVRILYNNHFGTHESCQGGPQHAYKYPNVIVRRLEDNTGRIRSILQSHGYKIRSIREGNYDRHNPYWNISFQPWPELSQHLEPKPEGLFSKLNRLLPI